jgi:hypothetical protein
MQTLRDKIEIIIYDDDGKFISLGSYHTLQGAWLARRWGERAYLDA